MGSERAPSARTSPFPDVIPIRPGEDFDHAKLAEFLAGKLPGVSGPPQIWQFPGGHANLTYLLYYPGAKGGAAEFTLRRPPIGPVAATSHDMGREYRVLSVLYRTFPLAPRAYVYCEDPAIIGAPFFVMERRHGIVVRNAIPPEFGGGQDSAQNRKLSEVLIDTLADFHRVDPVAAGLASIGKPEGFMQRQVAGWTQRWERAKTRELPVATEVAGWLAESLPRSPSATLLHNDWRLDNMMIASDDPGRAVAVFDWDMCTLGDPLADLGTLLTSWFQAGENVGSWSPMPSHTPGFLTRREAIDRYAARSGIDTSRIAYYRVFGLFKMAVVIQQIFFRYSQGQTRDERFAAFEAGVDGLLAMARTTIDRPDV
jgi:aminoglycoside phosphotransferase (APT) family kinase protein